MKDFSHRDRFPLLRLLALLLGCPAPGVRADQPPDPLGLGRTEAGLVVELGRTPVPPLGGTRYRLRVEGSRDLKSWESAGELQVDESGRPRMPATADGARKFFRLVPEVESLPGPVDGAEVFGFNRVFDEESARVGWLTSEAFARDAGRGLEYLPAITFDPTTAKFWSEFDADPAVANLGKAKGDPGYRLTDFRLNDAERAIFRKQGFVVSERLGRPTFANLFYAVFADDLPVYIGADSALHAWHLTYSRMLAELEETQLTLQLAAILEGMSSVLARVSPGVREGPLRNSLADADYFLAVGRTLLAGNPALTDKALVLGPNPHVGETLAAIRSGQLYADPGFEMFGALRPVDFSQYQVRGHYLRSQQLSNYFKAYLWTSRADLRVLDPDRPEQSLREFGTATVLSLLLRGSSAAPGPNGVAGGTNAWRAMDEVIRLFVGRSDAMNFAQLDPLLAAAGITSLESVSQPDQLLRLRDAIARGNLGVQLYAGDVHFSPFGPDQAQLPRAFVFTGQRFVADGWGLSKLTFDRIPWFEDIPGVTLNRKVLRRVPGGLDVAYAVLGNRQVGPLLAERMLAPRSPGNFRDGYPYAHRLAALASVFDRFDAPAWSETLYTRWLAALRELSAPTTGTTCPQAMRTGAWASHALNTQLASYAELKHDTLLYGKQAYAASILCEYPAGFVEPVPAFWRRMADLASAAGHGLARLPALPPAVMEIASQPDVGSGEFPRTYQVQLGVRQLKRIAACRNFALVMSRLETLASKELRQEPFTAAEVDFVRGLMNSRSDGYGGATYNGWYPGLFYNDYALESGTIDANGSNKYDALVADIFTAPPDQVDPVGGVLHVATGTVDCLLIAVDNGPDRMVYAGPVLSHYEFLEPGPALKRLTDADWQSRLNTRPPPRPDWTRDHLVPAR